MEAEHRVDLRHSMQMISQLRCIHLKNEIVFNIIIIIALLTMMYRDVGFSM